MKKLYILLTFTHLSVLSMAQIINTIAGNGTAYGFNGNNIAATAAQILNPYAVVADDTGNVYFADGNALIRKFRKSTGLVSTFAGGGASNPGNGGPATAAALQISYGIAIDDSANIYFSNGARVSKVYASTGKITTVAGTGVNGYNGTGIAATAAQLSAPAGLCLDAAGNLYIADGGNYVIRKVTKATGIISTVAGTGISGYNGDNITATSAWVSPSDVSVDPSGNLYICDGQRIREIYSATGIIHTIGGNGFNGYYGDGGPATAAEFWNPGGVKLDAAGNVYVSDGYNSRIREINTSTGIINTITGNGYPGYNGDGMPAALTQIGNPEGIAFDTTGNLYIADNTNNRIREWNPSSGLVSTVTGMGIGAGLSATSVSLFKPAGLVVDGSGNLYIAQSFGHYITKINPASGAVNSFIGSGVSFQFPDSVPADAAGFGQAWGLCMDKNGNAFISDHGGSIFKYNKSTNNVIKYGGSVVNSYRGDGGPATAAWFNEVGNLAVDDSDNVYIPDMQNNRVRKIYASTGKVVTIAGNGHGGFTGDGGKADTSALYYPTSVALDASGNVYIADWANNRVRKITKSTGLISTVIGNGSGGFPNNVPATSACTFSPYDIKVDANGNLFLLDGSLVSEVNHSTGLINKVVGGFTNGYSGDGGPATAAELNYPWCIALDASGNLYVSDSYNYRVRMVSSSVITSQPRSLSACVSSFGNTFNVTLSVTGATYQWQVNTGSGFANVTNTGVYSGATTNSLTISSPTLAISGYIYQCVINYFGTIVTNQVTLTVYPPPTVTATASPSATVCAGNKVTLAGNGASSYIWSGGIANGVPFTALSNNTYTVTGFDSHGCANTATQSITVNPNPTVTVTTDTVIKCSGSIDTLNANATGGTGSYTYLWSTSQTTTNINVTPANNAIYSVTVTDANSCTAIAIQTVTVNLPTTGDTNATACDSLRWYGTKYTTSGTPTHIVVNEKGCDSVITLHLSILNNTGDTNATACDSLRWYGTKFITSETSTHTLTNKKGCDSVVTLHLTINHSNVGDTNATACDSLRWYETKYTASATPTHTLTTAKGCDSVVTLHLTINHSNTGDTTATACDSLRWYETKYTASATPTHTLSTSKGCDSVVTLHLTINHSNVGDTNATACDSLRWYGTKYTASATPVHTLSTSKGCDSVVTLHLTINHSNVGDTNATACDSLRWYGTKYTASATPVHTLSTSKGCDSVVTLHLTINHSNVGDTNATACDSLRWYGTEYTASATPVHTLSTSKGCDSVVTLHLTVNTSPTISFIIHPDTVCKNAGVVTLAATPSGGTFTGTGVTGNHFDPSVVSSSGFVAITYSYTDVQGCSANATNNIYVSLCTGIAEIGLNNSIVLYPNPNNGKFNLTISNSQLGITNQVEVYNMLGEKVYTKQVTIDNSQFTIDLSNNSSGIYLYRVLTETGDFVAGGKFIISK